MLRHDIGHDIYSMSDRAPCGGAAAGRLLVEKTLESGLVLRITALSRTYVCNHDAPLTKNPSTDREPVRRTSG